MKKIFSFILAFIMACSCFVIFVSAESSNEQYEALEAGSVIFSGSYIESENRIEIQGNINYDVLVSHSDCTIEVYKLLPDQGIENIIFGNDQLLVASMEIAVKFSFSFEIKSSVDRFCRYLIVLCSSEGKRIVASQPKYLNTLSGYSYSVNGSKYFKGIYNNSTKTSVYSDVGAGTVIIPVYYDRLLSSMSNGYLFHHENDYFYFDKDYIDGLSETIRSYSASGTRVYLQLLLRKESLLENTDTEISSNYFMPNVYEPAEISYLCTFVRFLASKYDKYTEGKISGFIVGDNIDVINCNYSGEVDLEAYAQKYAYYLTVVANSVLCENSNLDIVVPVSGYNSLSEDFQAPNGVFSSGELLKSISRDLSRDCTNPLRFSLLVGFDKAVLEDSTNNKGQTVYVSSADNDAYIGVDNIKIWAEYIEDLSAEYNSTADNIIVKWNIGDGIGGNKLSASYAYAYYSLFNEKRVSSFVVSFENAHTDAFDTVKNLILNIDTENGIVESGNLLPLLGVQSWDKLIPEFYGTDYVIKTRYISDDFHPDTTLWTGSFSYVDFSLGNIRDFYDGSFSKGLKSDYGIDGRRVLNQTVAVTDGALHTDLFALFEYNENYIYTPTLKIDVGISEPNNYDVGALYEIKAIIGNGSSSVERTCVVKSGEIHSVWLDMSEFNGSNMADYVRVSTRSITGTTSEYSLLVYDICGYSTEKSSEELQILINEERARIRQQYITEDTVNEDNKLYHIVFIILIIAMLAIGVLFVFLRKEEDERR